MDNFKLLLLDVCLSFDAEYILLASLGFDFRFADFDLPSCLYASPARGMEIYLSFLFSAYRSVFDDCELGQ